MSCIRLRHLAFFLVAACSSPEPKATEPSDDGADGTTSDHLASDSGSGGTGEDGGDGGGDSAGDDGGTSSTVRTDIPSVAVCDGERLAAPPGGFVCTGVALPETAHFALLEVADSPAAVLVPIFEQDGQFVTIAPLLADVYGAWGGDVQYSIYDQAGVLLTSVDGAIAVSTVSVTNARETLTEWQEGISTAWAQHPNRAGRTVADLYQQLAGLYVGSLEESFAPIRWNDVPVEMDSTAGEAVARAVEQTRSELVDAGMSTDWSALEPGLVRGTHVFLPAAIVEPGTERDGIVFCGPAAVGLAIVAKVAIDGIIVATILNSFVDKFTDAGDQCHSDVCAYFDLLTPAPSEVSATCIELNGEDPLARKLGDAIPGEGEEPRELPEGEVYYDCIDEIDNDGDGLVDCADDGCLGYYGCEVDWSGRYEETSWSGSVSVTFGDTATQEYSCGPGGSYSVVDNAVQPFGLGLFLFTDTAPIGVGDVATPNLYLGSEYVGAVEIQLTRSEDGSRRMTGATSGSYFEAEGIASWSCSFSAELL